jgi:hypothetical protein
MQRSHVERYQIPSTEYGEANLQGGKPGSMGIELETGNRNAEAVGLSHSNS